MIDLETFNRKAKEEYFALNRNEPITNGIACPDCHAELYDSYPNQMLPSNPPQKNVHCESCGYKGYRVAR